MRLSSPPEWATQAERIVWHLDNSDGDDRRFRREIFAKWPKRIALAVAETYRDRYETKGQRTANLFLLDMQDKFEPSNMVLAWDDDQLIAEGKRASKGCRNVMNLYLGCVNHALGSLVHIANRYGLDVTHIDSIPGKDARITVGKTVYTVPGFISRVTDTDSRWWRRKLRQKHGRDVEAAAIETGLVRAQAGIYVSDETLETIRQQNKRNRRILESMLAVSDDGDSLNLAEIADSTISNPRIRRAELMTRVRGFEDCAKHLAHVAEFYTVTCPSRM
ncbi:MAG: replication endonuclease, partial [Thiobacillaceae bacterium]